MQAKNKRNFLLSQQLVPALINGLLNGGIAWAMHHEAERIGLWERGAYAYDLLATGLLLPFISWLILRPLLLHQAKKGKAPKLQGVSTPRLQRWMPGTLWGGALCIGLIGMLLLGGVSVLAMALAGAPDFSGKDYAVIKGFYAALLSAVLQPAMVFAALRNPAQKY
jgi:hypothetical protein